MKLSFTNVLPTVYTNHIRTNRQLISALIESRNQISTTWIPSHMNFSGNEVADSESRKALGLYLSPRTMTITLYFFNSGSKSCTAGNFVLI